MNFFIADEYVKLNPIGKDKYSLINLWYRQVDSFGFATGGKNPEEMMLHSSTFPCFVSGVYPANRDNCIGLIAGEFKKAREPVLWIRTFLVDTIWQRHRYGTHAFRLLCDYFQRNCSIKKVYVSVFAENLTGTAFWTSLGFTCITVLRSKDNKKNRDILILEKVIVH